MPTLKRINKDAGTSFRRTTELVAALKAKEKPLRHFQIKKTEYEQLCFRAPEHPEIVGFLWRINELGGRSATGFFGQVILFPAAMREWNTDIEYRVGGEYFNAKLPTATRDWQWVEGAEPCPPDEGTWYELDKPDAPPQDWKAAMHYDMWLLED